MQTVVTYSFRRGTGKSTILANLATLMVQNGCRIAVTETNFYSPSLFLFFNVEEPAIQYSLNDYLWGHCEMHQAAINITDKLPQQPANNGQLFILSPSSHIKHIRRMERGGHYLPLLNAGFAELGEQLQLDVLMIESPAGIAEASMLPLSIADTLIVIFRPDYQQYAGTATALKLAEKLHVPRLLLCLNDVSRSFDLNQAQDEIISVYGHKATAVLPHSEKVALSSSDLFVLKYPDHPVTARFQEILQAIKF